MTGEANPIVAVADQDVRIFDMVRTRTAKTLAGVGMVAATLAGCSSSHHSSSPEGNTANKTDVAACDTLEFDNAAADATKYESTAFFPKATLDSSDHVKTYTLGLFDKDGPLGGKADAASLALTEAAVTVPAKDTKVFNPARSIADAFDRKMAEYAGTNGLEAAKQDCAETDKVLVQVSGYNKNWAEKGDNVVRITAERDSQNRIIGVKLVNGVAGVALSGDEMVLRDSTKGYDGFGDFLIDDQGNLYLKGTLKENQESQKHEQQQAKSPSPTPSPENGGSKNQAQQGTNSQENGHSGGCNGCGTSGNCTTCQGGGGTGTGPGTGPTGPGGGGSGPGPSTGPSSGPSSGPSGGPSPSPSPKPTPTETTPPPSPSPSPTKPPATCDPNIYHC